VPLDHAWIAAHIPHQGTMCLLDRVDRWDAQRLRCIASSHRAADNPLRSHDRLASACGFEYASQAMAVHGALLAQHGEPQRSGFLASIRNAVLHVGRLDDIAEDLMIEAELVSSDGNVVLYDFAVRAGDRALLKGRATVVLDASMLEAKS
jgi:predicted hotdog family 3-hydroxylacyl-ACP dehydratase